MKQMLESPTPKSSTSQPNSLEPISQSFKESFSDSSISKLQNSNGTDFELLFQNSNKSLKNENSNTLIQSYRNNFNSEKRFTSFKNKTPSSPNSLSDSKKEIHSSENEENNNNKDIEGSQRNFKKTKEEKYQQGDSSGFVIESPFDINELVEFKKRITSDKEIDDFLNEKAEFDSDRDLIEVSPVRVNALSGGGAFNSTEETANNLFYGSSKTNSEPFIPFLVNKTKTQENKNTHINPVEINTKSSDEKSFERDKESNKYQSVDYLNLTNYETFQKKKLFKISRVLILQNQHFVKNHRISNSLRIFSNPKFTGKSMKQVHFAKTDLQNTELNKKDASIQTDSHSLNNKIYDKQSPGRSSENRPENTSPINNSTNNTFENKKLDPAFNILSYQNNSVNFENPISKFSDKPLNNSLRVYERLLKAKQVKSEVQIPIKSNTISDKQLAHTLTHKKTRNSDYLGDTSLNMTLNSKSHMGTFKTRSGKRLTTESISVSRVSINLNSPASSMATLLKKIVVYNSKVEQIKENLFLESPGILEKIYAFLRRETESANQNSALQVLRLLTALGIKSDLSQSRSLLLYQDSAHNFSTGFKELIPVLKIFLFPSTLRFSKIIGSDRNLDTYGVNAYFQENEAQLMRDIFRILLHKLENLKRVASNYSEGFLRQMFCSLAGTRDFIELTDFVRCFGENQKFVQFNDFWLLFSEFRSTEERVTYAQFHEYLRKRFI